jgi:hypothetical protein
MARCTCDDDTCRACEVGQAGDSAPDYEAVASVALLGAYRSQVQPQQVTRGPGWRRRCEACEACGSAPGGPVMVAMWRWRWLCPGCREREAT